MRVFVASLPVVPDVLEYHHVMIILFLLLYLHTAPFMNGRISERRMNECQARRTTDSMHSSHGCLSVAVIEADKKSV